MPVYTIFSLFECQVSWNLDGPIRANRFADSRGSLDSRESFQGSPTEPSRTEPFFANHASGGLIAGPSSPETPQKLINEIHDWKTRSAWILVINFRRRSYGEAGFQTRQNEQHQLSTNSNARGGQGSKCQEKGSAEIRGDFSKLPEEFRRWIL